MIMLARGCSQNNRSNAWEWLSPRKGEWIDYSICKSFSCWKFCDVCFAIGHGAPFWRHTNKMFTIGWIRYYFLLYWAKGTLAKWTHLTKLFQQPLPKRSPIKPVENDKNAVNTWVTEVYLEISFSKNFYHTETSQLICIANQMTSSCMTQFFTDW